MKKLYTIGFTQKNAETFFGLLNEADIDILLDIRLNNSSQLSAFSKYPDIEYFLKCICDIAYVHDTLFTPTVDLMEGYKKKKLTWDEYVCQFSAIMDERKIKEHITKSYMGDKNICLLCSEPKAERCHRSLVAGIFKDLDKEVEVIHL